LRHEAEYSYGRQLGGPDSHFSECRIFAKYYPEQSRIPQDGFFCNNANSALLRSAWETYLFDEELTGLEDMELAQRLVRKGGKVSPMSQTLPFSTTTTKDGGRSGAALSAKLSRCRRSCRRSTSAHRYAALPHCQRRKDWACAGEPNSMARQLLEQRSLSLEPVHWLLQGNHEHRKLSHAEKDKYFFPH
jgi:rhamnosyltransferase